MDKVWVIVGGADIGGIIVRQGCDLVSPKYDQRLGYASVVTEIELVGDRLHYEMIEGSGPSDGWISVKLKDKLLAVPALPRDQKLPSGEPVSMTFYAISDVHVEKKKNMEWLERLPKFEKSTVIVAGDVGVNLYHVEQALKIFSQKFDYVFYCYGNHETWAHKTKQDDKFGNYETSDQKMVGLMKLCDDLGVFTTAQLIEGVWVVPVLGWYHTSWDDEPPLQAPPGQKLARDPPSGTKLATDTIACKWECGYSNGSLMLAQHLDEQNEYWGVWPLPEALLENLKSPKGERQPVISFSHFLPRIELMPEKRFLFNPGLNQVVGSAYVRKRVDKLKPDLHIFGHSHFPWDMTLDDGVRYRSWPLGTPAEQARRSHSYPDEQTEQWYPLAVFDSNRDHYPMQPACWFSGMYSRIPRDPHSYAMADYVASSYCPNAPVVPHTIISPGIAIPPTTKAEKERRARYSGISDSSIQKEKDAAASSAAAKI